MAELRFELENRLVGFFPKIAAGGFVVENLDNAAAAIGSVTEKERDTRHALAERGVTVQNLASDPHVSGWRSALASCGLKPSTYKSSVEQLARRYLKGQAVSTPLAVGNLYCPVSARHLAPLGGYDLGRLPRPEVVLRMGKPDTDRFRPLGGRPEDMPIRSSVPVYACGDEVICFAFNHRDSSETCLRMGTNVAAFFSEAATDVQRRATEEALADLSSTLRSLGANPGPVVIADAGCPHVVLTL